MKQYATLKMRETKHFRFIAVVLSSVVSIIALAIVQDFFVSLRNDYAFFFSESLLFKAYWIVFLLVAPVSVGVHQIFFSKKREKWHFFLKMLMFVSISISLHAVLYSLAVYVLSVIFFDHTYSIVGNLTYTLTNDSLMSLVIYGIISFFAFRSTPSPAINNAQTPRPSMQHILVGTSKHRVSVPLRDICCITSSAPYISIQTTTKEYLHAETLKALHEILPQEQFIRIHKSTIINLEHIVSSTSRLNGDYDILLANGQEVRLSRNYAKDFKEKFERFGNPLYNTSAQHIGITSA